MDEFGLNSRRVRVEFRSSSGRIWIEFGLSLSQFWVEFESLLDSSLAQNIIINNSTELYIEEESLEWKDRNIPMWPNFEIQ